MKLKPGKECRIYGKIDNVRVIRVTGDNVIVRCKNGQCRAVSAKNLRKPVSKKFRWLAGVIDFIFTPQTHQIKIHKPTK
jgi:hypothetical protein